MDAAQVEGVVEEIIFRNEQNGYTVLSVKDGREHITCVGTFPAVASGERLLLTGEWTEHRDYGRQLRVSALESVRPTTLSGIERYLGSGIVRGVGPATAKLIVHHFGKDALDILDMWPERLVEIAGIGPKRAQMIAQSYQEQRETRRTMVFLQTYGLSPALATRVIRTFGEDAQRVVKSDPYQLVERVEGVGFKTADAIAFSLGIERDSEHRMTCGVLYVLSEATHASGHMYLPRDVLVERARALLQADASAVERALRALILDGYLLERQLGGENAIYERHLYEAEREVSIRLVGLMRVSAPAPVRDIGKKLARYEAREGVTLGAEQQTAVRLALQGALCVITGGPGTGKTTCIRCMLEILSEAGETLLCAPTGRAAKRMQEASGAPAKTIHRLLEYSGEGGGFTRDEDNPLHVDALIVDEVSMVDVLLMRSLLRALQPGTRLVLVGDADQLPSVGAGNVLGDLIESGAVPVVRLNEIYRQAQTSAIVMNAHRINRGDMPLCNQRGSDFFFERMATAQQAVDCVCQLVKTRLPGFLNADAARAIQVMSPMKKGDAGVWALNRRLQAVLNPPAPGKEELHAGDGIFRMGDKVMQIRNNYDLVWTRAEEQGSGAFNGDIGFVTAIDREESTVEVTFDDDRIAVYAGEALEDLEIAYCMTVHKSQGSEFEAVVLPLVSGPPMLLTRNLLYTAVTRARRLVVLVGRDDCVSRMVENNYVSKRYSALSQALSQALGDIP